MIWALAIKTNLFKRKIKALNRLACTLITGIKRSKPQMSLDILTAREPFSLHIEKTGLTAYIRQNRKLDVANWATSKNV